MADRLIAQINFTDEQLEEIKQAVIDHFQLRKGKWIDGSDEGYVECPFCRSATNCDDNIDELHYCWNCGAELTADMRGEEKNEKWERDKL